MARPQPHQAPARPTRPTFGTLNEHLVCTLCKGYFVDATTVIECLHSFCRSCIVQYLQASTVCPRPSCEVQLHKGSPLRSLKPDKTLQDIVYKLVPNLFHNEMQRRRVYYDAHPQYADQTTPEQRGDCLERFYSPDDSISLSLEYHDRRKPLAVSQTNGEDKKTLPPKRYLKCPALFTVGLLKKFIRLKFDLPPEITIDIFQRRESLADECTLLDIAYIYPWKRSEPMQFFYRIRDPRVLELDDEVEREMPALSAAVSCRAARATRRASSASSLSPRGSPVPKKIKLELCDDKDPAEAPQPPSKLTSVPPAGAQAVQPKLPNGLSSPLHVSPPKSTPSAVGSPSPLSPTSAGPKITLTISPSRGTVTSSTTELPKPSPAPVKSASPAAMPAKPVTPVQHPVKKTPTSSATPVKTATSTAPKASFAATVTTRTANGGFVTVKNPVARTPNGVTVGKSGPLPATPGLKPLAPKPSFSSAPKTKRLSNGLPVLAPKTGQNMVSNQRVEVKGPALPVKNAAVTNGALQAYTAEVPKTSAGSVTPHGTKPLPSAPDGGKSQLAEKNAEDEKKVETAKAILQLSMGFKRCNTPTDTTLHNRIDKIVKDLQDEDSGDNLVIKSEPVSPAPTPDPSPRNSPGPRDPVNPAGKGDKENATATPTLPKVNGLTITPIDPAKRKSVATPNTDEKRPKMSHPVVAALKRNADSSPPSQPKPAKVDKIAESIQESLLRQQERKISETQRVPSPQQQQSKAPSQKLMAPQAAFNPQQNVQKSMGNQLVQGKPVNNTAQLKQVQTQATPQQPKSQQGAAPPKPQQAANQPKPQHGGAPSKPQQAVNPPRTQQVANPPKPPQAANQPKPHQAAATPKPQQSPAAATPKPQASSKPALQPSQATKSVPQLQTINKSQPHQTYPAKANQPQSQAKPMVNGQPQPPTPTAQQQTHKPVAQTTASQQPNKKIGSPESPVRNKKPIPDLQRLQKPPSSLSSTTVNGSLSLAEVKEHLAKKGQYSPPPLGQAKTPPKLLDMPQRKSAPPTSSVHRDGYGALDLSSASPRAEHGGSWTPPPSIAQTLAKRHHLLAPQAHRPPPSSLSSSSPSPPADSPGSSVSPDLFLDQSMLYQQQQVLLQHLQLQSLTNSLLQAQAGLSPGLKKAMEERDRMSVKSIALPKRK